MASNDLASIAAATAAGYSLTRTDLNGKEPAASQFRTQLEKHLGGIAGEPGSTMRAYGYGASAGAADTAALNALNSERSFRYGFDSAVSNAGTSAGSTSTGKKHTKDTT